MAPYEYVRRGAVDVLLRQLSRGTPTHTRASSTLKRRCRAVVAAVALGAVVACESEGGATTPPTTLQATKLAFLTQPNEATAGSSLTSLQVAFQDASGTTVPSASAMVTVAIASNSGPTGAVLKGTVTRAALNGVATFDDLAIEQAGSGYTLTASAPSLSSASSAVFTIAPATPAKLAVMAQPVSATAGAMIAPAVRIDVQDAFGNRVTNGTTTITVAIANGTGAPGASLGGTVTQTAANGVASFANLTIDMPGSAYALTASAAGLASATTASFAVNTAAASKLTFSVQPSGVLAGATMSPSPKVTVQDALGNTVSSATTSITLAISPGTGAPGAVLGGANTVTAVNGVATFSAATIAKAATGYTLAASAPGLTGATSTAFNVSPAAPAKLAFSVQPSAVSPGAVMSPAIRVAVQDAFGNAVTTATSNVSLGITAGTGTSGAVLGGTLTRAAASGVATFDNITVDRAGPDYTLSAASTPLASATSTAFSVAAAAPSGCASPQPNWIWCDDFEVDRLSSYFEVVTEGGSFARVAGVGRNNSLGMRSRFAVGQVGAGALKLAFGRTPSTYFKAVDAGTADYREIYWRFYVRNAAGWIGGGGDKLTRATVFATSNWAQAMIAHLWSGAPNSGADINYLVLDPASGTDAAGNLRTTTWNDFPNLRWLGATRGITPIFDASHVGQWYCVEARVRLNTAGQSNGVFEFWINDQLEASRTNLNWVGAYSAYGINAILLENWWNAGSPANQERYFDDFVVSQTRIGC